MKSLKLLKSISLLRFARGYVTFKANGGFPDKFFNSCRKMGINMFNMKHVDGNIIADVHIDDYRKMPIIRRESEMSVEIIKKTGIPFILYKRRSRKGIIIGIFLFLIITQVLSSCVWTIDVEGCESIDKNVIKKIYADNGIHIGTYMRKINAKLVEENVVENVEGLIWTAFNTSGGRGVIKVREGDGVPRLKASIPPRNVIAKYDGRIITYEVYEGTPEQELYAAVTKGDLLISGVLTFMDGSVTLRPADGKVEAETKREVRINIDENFALERVKNAQSVNKVHFFGLHIPLFTSILNKDSGLTSNYEEYFVLNDVMLPIGVTKSKNIFLEKMTNKEFWTKDAKKRLLVIGLDEFFMVQSAQIESKNIVENTVDIRTSDNATTFVGKYNLVENICDYSELHVTSEQ